MNADLWQMEKEARGIKSGGGAKAMAAFAAVVNDGKS